MRLCNSRRPFTHSPPPNSIAWTLALSTSTHVRSLASPDAPGLCISMTCACSSSIRNVQTHIRTHTPLDTHTHTRCASSVCAQQSCAPVACSCSCWSYNGCSTSCSCNRCSNCCNCAGAQLCCALCCGSSASVLPALLWQHCSCGSSASVLPALLWQQCSCGSSASVLPAPWLHVVAASEMCRHILGHTHSNTHTHTLLRLVCTSACVVPAPWLHAAR